jgi:hypothetical protein
VGRQDGAGAETAPAAAGRRDRQLPPADRGTIFETSGADDDNNLHVLASLADLDMPREGERAAHMTSMQRLVVRLVVKLRRRAYLRAQPAPRRRSREELLALMDLVSRRTWGSDVDVDEEIRRLRDDPRG